MLRSIRSILRLEKNKQTNEAARPEESGYDIENQSAHTHLVSGL